MKRLPINIRFGAWHFQWQTGPHLYRNKGHDKGGEFRKPGWKWFAVYSLFGWVT